MERTSLTRLHMSFLLTPPKRIQGSKPGPRYVSPPLDGSLAIPQIYDWHYRHNPNHPVFVHAYGPGGLRYFSFSEVVPAAHRAGRYVADVTKVDLRANPATFPVVAILSIADTITYFTTLVGMLRAGITAFPISPRFSAPVIAHLLANTQAMYIIVSADLPMHDLAQKAVEELRKTSPHNAPEICSMPKHDEIYLKDAPFVLLPPREYDYSSPALIVHSSSSTSSFPKAIKWNARSNLQNAMVPLFGAHNLCGQVVGCHAIELFHTLGLFFIFWLSGTGLVMATFPPASPATPPTPDAVFRGFRGTNPSYVLSSPRFIETWSLDPVKVKFLSCLKGVVYGGKFLSKMVGDYLAKEGVSLCTVYGSTESGQISSVLSESQGSDWEYFTLNPHCAAEFISTGDGTYEVVVVSKPTQELTIHNTKFHDQDAYAMGDLLIPHPSKPGHWKILGRLDDQVMLSTGEVTNPSPLEDILCQHPQVSAAVIFGRARPQNGVLIELRSENAFDPHDMQRLTEFRNAIWAKVKEMNACAPMHSRLSKEMIIVTSPCKPFTYTQKGAPKRPVILHDYQAEIDALYGGHLTDTFYGLKKLD